MRNKLRTVLAALLVAAGGGACGGDGSPAVTVKTNDFSFEMPAEITGGLVELELDNTAGKESHEADLVRLQRGKTLDDVLEASAQPGPPPPWMEPAGGPGPVLPGKKATYTGNLSPGTYVLQCHVRSPDGKSHVEKGMIALLKVTEGEEGTLPEGDVTIGANEFDFTGLEGLEAGVQTVRVENQGRQPHHWAVVALARGETPQDFSKYFAAVARGEPPQGPPPFTGFPGLVSTLPPGAGAVRTLELERLTTYMFVCFVPDTDGVSHAEKGMAKAITIR